MGRTHPFNNRQYCLEPRQNDIEITSVLLSSPSKRARSCRERCETGNLYEVRAAALHFVCSVLCCRTKKFFDVLRTAMSCRSAGKLSLKPFPVESVVPKFERWS